MCDTLNMNTVQQNIVSQVVAAGVKGVIFVYDQTVPDQIKASRKLNGAYVAYDAAWDTYSIQAYRVDPKTLGVSFGRAFHGVYAAEMVEMVRKAVTGSRVFAGGCARQI